MVGAFSLCALPPVTSYEQPISGKICGLQTGLLAQTELLTDKDGIPLLKALPFVTGSN